MIRECLKNVTHKLIHKVFYKNIFTKKNICIFTILKAKFK